MDRLDSSADVRLGCKVNSDVEEISGNSSTRAFVLYQARLNHRSIQKPSISLHSSVNHHPETRITDYLQYSDPWHSTQHACLL